MRLPNPIQRYYYGWNIALALAITTTISYGVMFYAFSVFLPGMEAELGWTRGQTTLGLSLALLVSALAAVPIGTWVDKHGARGLMTVGSVGATVLVLLWSQVETLLAFYAIWVLMGVCMAAVFYEPAFAVIANWFQRSRGRALTLVTLMAGFASTIFIPLSGYLQVELGWRAGVLLLGTLLGVVTIPLHALVLRRRPADLGLEPDGQTIAKESTTVVQKTSVTADTAIRSGNFWRLTIAFTLMGLGASAIRIHFFPYLLDRDIDPVLAAQAAGAIGAMQVLGRLIFAPLDERISRRAMIVGIFGLQLLSLLILAFILSDLGIWMFVLTYGASIGALTLARPSLIAELYGVTHYGRISSIMVLFSTIGGTIAPVGAGALYDLFGSYQPVLYTIIFILTLSVIAVLFVQTTTDSEHSLDPALSPKQT